MGGAAGAAPQSKESATAAALPAAPPSLADELTRAAARGGIAALVFLLAAGWSEPTWQNRAGDLTFCLLTGAWVAALAFAEVRLLRAAPLLGPKSAAFLAASATLVVTPILGCQALYCAELLETGSPGAAFSQAWALLSRDPYSLLAAVFALAPGIGLAWLLRFHEQAWREKLYFAGAAALFCLWAYLFSLAELSGDERFEKLLLGALTPRRLLLHLGLAAGAALPLLALISERLWGPARGAPELPFPAKPTKLRRLVRYVAAVGLPVLGCLLNTSGVAPLDTPEWAVPGWHTYHQLLLEAPPQYGLYPLLLWAMGAFVAAEGETRRRTWIEVGLAGGVVLTGLYCLAFVSVLPLALILLLAGIGLLGLAPFFAFVAFSQAWFRYRARCEEAKALRPASLALAGGWFVGLQLALLHAVNEVNRLHSKLPTEPPYTDCYIASASARASRLAGAREVRFANGEVAVISRQLRVLKLGEHLIRHFSPGLHAALRAVYDRLGPPLARRLGPWSASLAYLLLKVPQAAVEATLRLAGADLEESLERVYPSE